MSIKLKDTISDLINKANKDGSGNTITSTYLKKTGDVLNTKGEQYNGNYGINLNNSDIIGANSITFNDYCESSHEGIRFCRSDVSGKYDAISARNGVFYFSPNGTISTADTTGSFPTDYVVLHSNNYSTYAATKDHNHNSTYAPISHSHSQYYDSTISRTANTILAAPNGSSGNASFRKLVAADIPTLAISKISGLQSALDGKMATHTHPYLPVAGGTMNSNASITFQGSGGIYYKGTHGNYQMIGFLDNTGDAYGDGIRIGGGGTVIVGAGESSTALVSNSIVTDFNDENLHLSADYNIIFYSNCNTISSRKFMTFDNGGTLSVNGTAVSLSGHTHSYASKVTVGSTAYSVSSNNITIPAYPTIPTALKCPASLTIQLNGTSQGAWNGSAAKTINITPSSIGAAASHSHPYLPLAGGTMNSGACITFANGNGATTAIALTNSNITGVNAIYTSDKAEGGSEGIQFARSTSGKYDSVWASDGTLYFSPNGDGATYSTNYTVYHSGNFSSSDGKSLLSHYGTSSSNDMNNRPSSADLNWTDKRVRYFLATSTMTTGKPPADSKVLYLAWDNSGWASELAVGSGDSGYIWYRNQGAGNNATTWTGWRTVIDSSNYTSYCAKASHTHSYLPLSGGTINNGALNMTNNRLRMVGTSATPAWNQAGAITWCESVDDGQPVSIVYTSYDSYRAPAGLKVMGSQGGEWFEAPKIYTTNLYIGGSEITFIT